MKAKPFKWNDQEKAFYPCEAKDATHVMFLFPEPIGHLRLPVVHGNTTRAGTGCWSWNGSTDKPTVRPSILTDASPAWKMHCWLNDGQIQFLNDTTIEELRDKTIPCLEVEE